MGMERVALSFLGLESKMLLLHHIPVFISAARFELALFGLQPNVLSITPYGVMRPSGIEPDPFGWKPNVRPLTPQTHYSLNSSYWTSSHLINMAICSQLNLILQCSFKVFLNIFISDLTFFQSITSGLINLNVWPLK